MNEDWEMTAKDNASSYRNCARGYDMVEKKNLYPRIPVDIYTVDRNHKNAPDSQKFRLAQLFFLEMRKRAGPIEGRRIKIGVKKRSIRQGFHDYYGRLEVEELIYPEKNYLDTWAIRAINEAIEVYYVEDTTYRNTSQGTMEQIKFVLMGPNPNGLDEIIVQIKKRGPYKGTQWDKNKRRYIYNQLISQRYNVKPLPRGPMFVLERLDPSIEPQTDMHFCLEACQEVKVPPGVTITEWADTLRKNKVNALIEKCKDVTSKVEFLWKFRDIRDEMCERQRSTLQLMNVVTGEEECPYLPPAIKPEPGKCKTNQWLLSNCSPL